MKNYCLYLIFVSLTFIVNAHADNINGFKFWSLGKDKHTDIIVPTQYIHKKGALKKESDYIVAQGKFSIVGWGEMYVPISQSDREAESPVDLSSSKWVMIEYASNREVYLQLRHAFVHGGTHNHFILPSTQGKFKTTKIYFSSFKGGIKPLDLATVSKFNFAMIGKNQHASFSEIKVKKLIIDNFNENQ